MWDKVKGVIGTVAPTVAGLIGGKAGEAVVSAVANILGCEADPGSIEKALANNPDKLVEIKKYEMDHKVRLQEIELEASKSKTEVMTKEIESGDPFLRRARPAIIYTGLLMVIINHWLMPWFAWFALILLKKNIPLPEITIPDIFWDAWQGVVSIYVIGRSLEKMTGQQVMNVFKKKT